MTNARLGRGMQYAVYRSADGRVRKRYHSWPYSFAIMLRVFGIGAVLKAPRWIRDNRRKARRSISLLVHKGVAPRDLANAEFTAGSLHYTQDLAVPVATYVANLNDDEAGRVIGQGVRFMKRLHDEYGFIDESFNLAQNFGVVPGQQIVMIDIGELVEQESTIRALRGSRAWASEWCTMHFPDRLRPVFVREMDGAFGLDGR